VRKKKKTAIVGCGAIGSAIAYWLRDGASSWVSSTVLFDTDQKRSLKLSADLGSAQSVVNIEEAVNGSDLVIEAAQQSAAAEVLELATRSGKDVMILSIGGLTGKEYLLEEASKAGITVMLPSGAIGGIDAVKAARIAGIDSVVLTTRKSPDSLSGAPYLEQKGIDPKSIKSETLVFEGTAREAVSAFPKNINVSALLALAGSGSENTIVRIISSPDYKRNIHEIKVRSKAGDFSFRTENVSFPSNPKTSYLAALSAMTALEGYFSGIRIGS